MRRKGSHKLCIFDTFGDTFQSIFVDEVLDLIDIPDIAALYRKDMLKVLERIGEEVEA